MEQAPPGLGEGWSGCQLPGCLVGVCVCVRVRTECIDGDVRLGMPQSWALS